MQGNPGGDAGRPIPLLQGVFGRARQDTLHTLAEAVIPAGYRRGEEVGPGGSGGLPLIIVQRGIVARVARGPEGREIAYGLLRPGEVGGLGGLASAADVGFVLAAWTDCDVALWPGDFVRALALRDPGLAVDLVDASVALASVLALELEELLAVGAQRRLARILLRYPDLLLGEVHPVLRRSHLASLMGTSREMMERCIRQLEARAIVQRNDRGGLVLLDPEELAELAA